MNAKDQFQIICYENNNIAFFADTVVLVEGDSDYLVLPHIASVLDTRWEYNKTSVRFARINGKTSIRRYKNFFSKFNARVLVIADLDLILQGFEQIEPTAEMLETRQALLIAVDAIISPVDAVGPASTDIIKKAQERKDIKAIWFRAQGIHQRFKDGKATFDELHAAVEEFFAWQNAEERMNYLMTPTNSTVCELKAKLLRQLRLHGIFVLEKGDIEAYYPATVTGADKPTRAQDFCNSITARDTALALCPDIDVDGNGTLRKEFEVIFSEIFGH